MISVRARKTVFHWSLLASLTLAGCAASPPRVPVPTGEAPALSDSVREDTARASASLLEQSRQQQTEGDYAAATASIERALRIEPNNASLWVELAEIKMAEGDADQAEAMARKALTLSDNDRSIENRANRLINR